MNDTTAIATRHEDQMRALTVPGNVGEMWELAVRMFKAGLVPSSIKSPECAYLAMMKGAEYGLLPQQSVAGFYVIGNIAHPYGTCLNGIARAAQSHDDEIEGCIEGLAEMRYIATEENEYKPGSARHEMFAELQRSLRRRLARVEEKIGKDKAPATYFCGWAVMKRKGCDPVCVLFDTFEAQRGGLTQKDMWGKWTTRMYMHRAATFNRRDTFADALMGLDATYEEMTDGPPPIDLGTQPAPPASPRVVQQGSPSTVLATLSGRATPPPAPAPEAPTAPLSSAEQALIYKGAGNAAPTSDVPLEEELGEEGPTQAEPVAAPAKPGKMTGKAALKDASERLAAAGLDAKAIGKEVITTMFGEGITSKDLSSDTERYQVAQAMLDRLDVAPGDATPVDDDPAEF